MRGDVAESFAHTRKDDVGFGDRGVSVRGFSGERIQDFAREESDHVPVDKVLGCGAKTEETCGGCLDPLVLTMTWMRRAEDEAELLQTFQHSRDRGGAHAETDPEHVLSNAAARAQDGGQHVEASGREAEFVEEPTGQANGAEEDLLATEDDVVHAAA